MTGLILLLLAIAAFGLWMSVPRVLDALLTGKAQDRGRVAYRSEEPVRFARYLLSSAIGLAASLALALLALSMAT